MLRQLPFSREKSNQFGAKGHLCSHLEFKIQLGKN